ncbi:MAG: LamG domain-containing protein [Colwellia sp.]|nr:LamG domain-containing protein [Colwellia sp.]
MFIRLYFGVFLYLTFLVSVEAAQCSATFADGLTNSHANGKIKFENSSQLLNNPDKILATTFIEHKNTSLSCQTTNCKPGGFIIPALSASYLSYSSNTNLTVNNGSQTITTNNYKDVEVKLGGSLTMSNRFSTYRFKTLKLKETSTVYLTAGDYYFDNIEVKSSSKLIVIGPGYVRLFVKNKANFKESAVINGGLSGDPRKLIVYLFADQKSTIKIQSGATYAGYIYSQSKVEIKGGSSHVFGAISSIGELKLKNGAKVTYANLQADFGDLCSGAAAPIAEYRFDEIEYHDVADEVIDTIGDYHGQAKNAQPIAGKICHAVDLSASGIDDYVILDKRVLSGKSDFTVSLWAKTAKKSNQSLVSGASSFRDNELIMWFDNHKVFRPYLKGSSNGGRATESIADNNWHHLVWTRKGSQSCLYRDKLLQGCVTQSSYALNIQSLLLGQEQNSVGGDFVSSQAFEGLIDEVLIFDKAISTGQISEIYYNQDIGLNYDGTSRDTVICGMPLPIVDYRFDECSYNGSSGKVLDQIGTNHGKTYGVPDPVNDVVINNSIDLTATGIDDWLTVPRAVVDGLDDFTVSFWVNTLVNKDQQEVFHALGDSASDDELEIFLKGGNQVYIKVRDNSETLTSNIKLTDGTWHHIALTRVGEDVCLFVDGKEQGCNDGVDSGVLYVPKSNAIVIGQEQDAFGGDFSDEQGFEGKLDEFKIYKVRLSSRHIDTIYQNELADNNYDGSSRDEVRCDNNCEAGTLYAVGIRIGGGGSNSQINTTTEALTIYDAWLAAGSPVFGLINGGTYNVVASGSSTVDRIDFGGSDHDFSGTLPYPSTGVSGEDFLVHASGTLSLPAGDYTIYVESDDGFSFIMDTLSGDTVLFNKFGGSTSGGSNELRFETPTANSNTGGSFTLNQDSVFDITAIFFERGGGDFFEISIANDIRTYSASRTSSYEILKHGALSGKVKFGDCVGPSQIDHFKITHNGQGLTCEGESVTIEACATSDCLTLSTEPVNLDFQADGATISSPTFTGSTTVNVNHIIVETLTLSVTNPTITPGNALVCVNTSGGSSCDLNFVEAGFVLEINGANDVESCDLTKLLLIRAVKLSDNGVSCAPAFTGSQSLNFVFNYQNPSTGTKVPTLGITNMLATGVSQTRSVTFNGDGEATLAIQYHDAGELSFSVSELVSSGVNSATLSKEFYPTKLVVSTALTSTDSDGVITQVAGENFPINIIAQCQNGDPTPNYSPQSNSVLQLSVQQKEPITNTGTLTIGSVDVGATNLVTTTWADANQTTVNFNGKYSEVGIINLAAQDTNYLGNPINSASYSTVGRFIPDHFDVDITSNAFADTCTTGTSDFTYIGQPFTYLNPPKLLITAKNKSGITTKNYTEIGYQKLVATNIDRTFPLIDSTIDGADDASKMVVSASPNVGGLEKDSAGVLKYTFDEDDTFTYTKNSNSMVKPFQVDYNIIIDKIQDSDSVNASVALNVSPSSDLVSPTGVNLRFGRWAVKNAFGPETSDLPVPMAVQYYDGSNFITNTLDNCTNYNKNGLTLLSISLAPNGYDGSPATGMFSDGEINALYLNATGAGNQGKVKIIYTVPAWLQYDWSWNGVNAKEFNENPTSTATFGLFRGNDRIIYQREVH